jgi:class 3 adenylate cyclase/CHASE2 domain-containing sensor protein
MAVALVLILDLLPLASSHFDVLQRVESMTFDWRVRLSAKCAAPVAPNLAAVFIDDETLADLSNRRFYGLYISWPFPRQLHGRVIRELSAQQAGVIGFDVLFDQRRIHDPQAITTRDQAVKAGFTELELAEAPSFPFKTSVSNQAPREVPGVVLESDDFFAVNMRRSQRVVLGSLPNLMPHACFLTNAWAVANIEGTRPNSEDKDNDGILRRFKAFSIHRYWHPEIQAFADAEGLDLNSAVVSDNQVRLQRATNGPAATIAFGPTNLTFLTEEGRSIRVTIKPGTQPFTDSIVWQMGIVLAAHELGLDLAHPDIDLKRGRIILSAPSGLKRIIPVDDRGRFIINWYLTWNDPRILSLSYGALLSLDELRNNPDYTPDDYSRYLTQLRARSGKTNLVGNNPFQNKLVLIGSVLSGNNLADLGSTPLSKQTFLVSANFNVANSLITNQWVRPFTWWSEWLIVALLGSLGGWITWQSRGVLGSFWILGTALLFSLLCAWLYVAFRWWIPMVMPLAALAAVHGFVETYWVAFAQREQRRVKGIFSKLVSPEVVDELLRQERLALGGARRQVTIFFADVRGFTELTDQAQEKALEQAKGKNLTDAEIEAFLDTQSREVLDTVNLYLGTIANVIKKHNGTFDKYIGDCVMAFWGAPTPNRSHALSCVRAAIDAQREVFRLNLERQGQNRQRETENAQRRESSQPPLPLLPLLTLGTGINTGTVTVGLMGADDHILNYTAFGREVALASRLESISGRARIIISATTYAEVLRDDPALAKTCVKQSPVIVKGFRQPIETFEVPWKATPALEIPRADDDSSNS